MAPPTPVYHHVTDRPECPLKVLTQYQCVCSTEGGSNEIICTPFLRKFRQCANQRLIEVTALAPASEPSSTTADISRITVL